MINSGNNIYRFKKSITFSSNEGDTNYRENVEKNKFCRIYYGVSQNKIKKVMLLKYFLLKDDMGWENIYFQNKSLSNIKFKDTSLYEMLSINPKEFVKKANKLFIKYDIKVPDDYSKDFIIKIEGMGWDKVYSFPTEQFLLCVKSCIEIEETYSIETSKVLIKELIRPRSRMGVIHACTMSVIMLYYLKKGFEVEVVTEDTHKTPDLKINNLNCEIKTLMEWDWTVEMDPSTGEGKEKSYSENLCYDIGAFIAKRNSGHKGIKQSDVIFADLSLKSLGELFDLPSDLKFDDSSLEKFLKLVENSRLELPELKKNRIIFFSRIGTNCFGFYIDFQPELWTLIKKMERKTKKAIYPPPLKVPEHTKGQVVAHYMSWYYGKLPEEIRDNLLLLLSEKEGTSVNLTLAIHGYFNIVPENIRNNLLVKFSEDEDADNFVLICVKDHFNEFSIDIRNKILLTIAKKQKYKRIINKIIESNSEKISQELKNEILSYY